MSSDDHDALLLRALVAFAYLIRDEWGEKMTLEEIVGMHGDYGDPGREEAVRYAESLIKRFEDHTA